MNEKIACRICGAQDHVMQSHLRAAHPDMTAEQYQIDYPGAQMLSELAIATLAKKRQAASSAAAMATASTAPAALSGMATDAATLVPKSATFTSALHEVFELGPVRAAMSVRGEPVMITMMAPHSQQDVVPAISDHYVYDIDELKNVILALELKIPCLLWGHKGSGKSELFEQVYARTNRPLIRVQHSANTEESHITGQWTVKGGQTEFELGPLPMAMINGWGYCADEYDFGQPAVLAVYQAVLEGKPLLIKEAPAHIRIIRPHSMFRFLATSNTNGSGDESGLYQGTLIQNSANYDRFGVVIHKQYMAKEAESQILQNHCRLTAADADKMVDFANLVRQSYDAAKISDTVSPRTLIYAAKIGVKRGSFRMGIQLSFINKLGKIDREVAGALAQRIFG